MYCALCARQLLERRGQNMSLPSKVVVLSLFALACEERVAEKRVPEIQPTDSDSDALTKYLAGRRVSISAEQHDAILHVCKDMRAGMTEADLEGRVAKRDKLLVSAENANHSAYDLFMILLEFKIATMRCMPIALPPQ